MKVDHDWDSRSPLGGSRSPDDFAVWVTPHLQAMANLAARLVGNTDRDDLVQEALSRAWRRWETYKPERGSPQTWLLAIVADRARRVRHRPKAAVWSGQERLAPIEADLDLERAIQGLPRRQRLAVELHYFAGLTTAEIASVMSCAEGTVKSALHDARKNLRRALEQP
ncbi:MAG: RNA polymerase sigma factor [Acidimicrobiaceae bacterium]|nr:RNA polymerase sigma factor [Acidimicrobiaceae bacterium]